jgi:competence protein ComEA
VAKEINLARQLKEGEQLYIPDVAEQKLIAAQTTKSSTATTTTRVININTATSADLQTLPSIGASTAEKIIQARPFSQIDDIKNVSGIGDATFSKIKDLIQV